VRLSRRDLLRVLGAGAAAGALGAIGCGGPARPAPRLEETIDPREALREAVAQVRSRWPDASGWLATRERSTAIAGSDVRATARRFTATVVLRGRDGARIVERVVGDATATSIAAVAAELAAAGPGRGGTLGGAARGDHRPALKRDPVRQHAAKWIAVLDDNLARAEKIGSSRVVWRSAHAIVDDERTWFVGDGRDIAQRAVRVQSGLTLLAWDGDEPMIGEVGTARAAGLEALALDDGAIATATRRALERLTPGEAPAGRHAVLLDPSIVAMLIGAGIGDVVTSARLRRPDLRAIGLLERPIAAPRIAVTDDPTVGGFGGYHFDDEGWPAARTVLVDGGMLRGVLTDAAGAAALHRARTGHGRRRHGDGAVAARSSELVLAPGTVTETALRGALGDGLALEDAEGVVVEPRTWRVTIRARRARRIVRGEPTGHAWAGIELRGDVPGLLGAVRAIGDTALAFPCRGDDDAPAAAVRAPALVTEADVQPRRHR